MWELFFTVSLRFVAVIGALQLLLYIIGSNLYDLRQLKRQQAYRRHPHARRFRGRPLVSIMIVARNDEQAIGRCLDSVLASSYQNVELVVVDNVSHDGTKRVVNETIAAHPNRRLVLVAKRASTAPLTAAHAAFRTHTSGEIVMLLTPGQALQSETITRAVRYFTADAKLATLVPKQRTRPAFTSLGILQTYLDFLRHRTLMQTSALNLAYENSQAVLYRRDAFAALTKPSARPSLGNRDSRLGFADDVIIRAEAPQSIWQLLAPSFLQPAARWRALLVQRRLLFSRDIRYTKALTWFRLPLAVLTGLAAAPVPLLIGYFVYLAVALQEPTYLLASGALLSLCLGFAIWSEDQLQPLQKIAYCLGIPITYGLYALVAVVQAGVIVGSLLLPINADRRLIER